MKYIMLLTINSISSNIAPLPEFLRRLCKRHVGRNRRVNNSLHRERKYNFNYLQSRWSHFANCPHLCSLHRNNSIQVPRWIIEKANTDGFRWGCDPCSFRFRIDVKNMSLTCENRLLAVVSKHKKHCWLNRKLNILSSNQHGKFHCFKKIRQMRKFFTHEKFAKNTQTR